MRNLPYNRADRVGEQIYQLIASHIYEDADDFRLLGIQLTAVKLTKDLSIAKVYFYIAGGEAKQKECLEALEELELRHYIAQNLKLRIVPKLSFYFDDSVEKSQRIEELLKEIKAS